MNDQPSLQSQVSAAEWATRVDLAAFYRLVSHYRWEDLIYTHISAKVPGTEEFLINPYGLFFDEVTASNLIKIDLAGNKLSPSERDINPAGFIIHGAIHEARPDVQCICHVHTADGIVVSMQKDGLLPISQQATFVRESLAYHAYEGVSFNPEEKARLQEHLGRKDFLILANHGLLTCGESIPDTFLRMYILQRACEMQVKALSSGAELLRIPPEIESYTIQLTSKVNPNGRALDGMLSWPALLRRLDRVSPGYDR
jgi:ribulose-5-phosphate 4-epimerase/fuculose-1-phosphate aldolase